MRSSNAIGSAAGASTLTAREIDAMSIGLPLLSEWGENMLVPFSSRRLRNASVVWINVRWFLEHGIDARCLATRSRIHAWLMKEFAYAVPLPTDQPKDFTSESKTLWADRYGGSGLVPHGGSGRVSVSGAFQAKGVGPTPLVGRGTSWHYSNGCLWMEEAIREVIYSEIFASEFPHGANAVLAIIDTGLNYICPNGDIWQRRAIQVRESALRPAHFMRAPMFRPRNEQPSGQWKDAHRVAYAIEKLEGLIEDGVYPPIDRIFTNVAEQAAFGQAHRLFTGGYYPSNFMLSGGIIDFGAARHFPTWNRAIVSETLPGFGEEFKTISAAIETFGYYWNKHVRHTRSKVDANAIAAIAKAALHKKLSDEMVKMWNIPVDIDASVSERVRAAMLIYFRHQQRRAIQYTRGDSTDERWIGDVDFGHEGVEESKVYEAVRGLLEDVDGNTSTGSVQLCAMHKLIAVRYLGRSRELNRERMEAWLFENLVLQHTIEAPRPKDIQRAIHRFVSLSRRVWADAPDAFVVLGHIWTPEASALIGWDKKSQSKAVWIQAIMQGDMVLLFDHRFPTVALAPSHIGSSGKYWFGLFSLTGFDDDFDELEIQVTIMVGEQIVILPRISKLYFRDARISHHS
jgi:hypothetical protein